MKHEKLTYRLLDEWGILDKRLAGKQSKRDRSALEKRRSRIGNVLLMLDKKHRKEVGML